MNNYTPSAPGPQQPEKYTSQGYQVGPNYLQYGEIPGYVYIPWKDEYFLDPKANSDFLDSQGLGPPKEPGLLSQLAPVAAAAGAQALGQGLGSALGGLFGGGGGAAAGSTAAAGAPAAPTVLGASYVGGGAGGAGGAGAGAGAGLLGTLAPVAAAPLAALTAYESIRGTGNVLKGDKLSLTQQAALALPTFGTSFLYNPIRKAFGSKKGGDQRRRDAIRSNLKGSGLLDKDYNMTLASGQQYNMDDSKNPENVRGFGQKAHQVDFERDGIGNTVAFVDPLAELMTGDAKGRSDLSGMFTNAAMSGGDPMANIRGIYEQQGMNKESTIAGIEAAFAEGRIDRARRDAYLNSLNNLFKG